MVSFRIAIITATVASVNAFTTSTKQQPRIQTTSLHETSNSRREFFSTVAIASAAIQSPLQPAHAADTKDSLISDLTASLKQIETIPSLIDAAEWDKVRTVLKTPPVAELWNLGESRNTLVKLAKETGEFDLMEMKDELAISLQMTDQYVYDNNFIYYQPGK